MIWKHLGFNHNIFFVKPLLPDESDIKLFVGRDEEIKTYLIDTFSDNRSLKIVSGDVGVGKTTFVNACQYFSYTGTLPFEFDFEVPRALPCFEKIQLNELDDIDSFSSKVLLTVCQSISHHCRLSRIDTPTAVSEILSYFLDLKIKSGGGGFGGSVTFVGTGGSISKAHDSESPNVLINPRFHLEKMIKIAQGELGFQGVFVIVNNLDILTKDKLVRFVNSARDELFDIAGIYWTLIGRKGIGSIIETEASRVADYLSGNELCIKPLDFESTKLVIDKRVESFRVDESKKCPLTGCVNKNETNILFF